MARQLERRLRAIETKTESGRWLPAMQVIHDTADGGPLSEGQVQAIKQEEMSRRLAAGEALPGDDFVLIVHEIVHPMPPEADNGRA